MSFKLSVDHNFKCQIYVQSKQPRKPFKPVFFKDMQLLELIYGDVCDSKRDPTHGRSRYFVTFINDFSQFYYIFLLKTKNGILQKFKVYKAEIENQTKKMIKILRYDRGEYTSIELNLFCEEHRIIHENTAPYSPQSNGVAKYKNRTLMDMVNVMIISFGVFQNLWEEALLSACFILDKIPSKEKKQTP